MSRLPSIDDWWGGFDERAATMGSYRGNAVASESTQGVQENELGFWGYTADIALGVPRGIWGLAEAGSEAIYNLTGGFIGEGRRPEDRARPFGVSQTLPGGLVEGISQVAIPYGYGLKAVRAGAGALGLRGAGTAATAALGEQAVISAAAGQTGRAALLGGLSRGIEVGKMAAEGIAAGSIADTIAFSSWAPRLSDLATQSDNPLFNNALTQYLASDGDDSFLEGRLKNAIEGAFAGGAIDTILGAARVVRAGRRAAQVGKSPNAAMFAEHMDIRRQHREQIMGATGATPDEAELINMVIDATGMSRDRLSFAREAVQEVDEAGRPRRAAVDFYEDGKTVIRFFETADRTSPVHEISHVVRRRVLDRRIDPEYRMGLTDQDIKLIEDYVGVRDGEWDINAEENWAQLFERFMWDGVAPNHRVASIMVRSAEMMRSVYSRVEANRLLREINPEEWDAAGGVKGPEINPQVRQVMNKLMSRAPVTVDEAIRTFNRAGKRSAFSSVGHSLRAMMAATDNFLNEREAADAVDGVYREERLYQSAKRVAMRTTEEGYPVKRGREEIINRLRRESAQGELDPDEMGRMQRLIEVMPPELVAAMGVRFRQSRYLGNGKGGGAVLGQYSFGRNIVTMASDFVRGAEVKTTWAHEWGHAISSFLGDDIVKSLKDDYTRAYNKFVRLEGVDPRAKEGTEAFKALREWAGKNPNRWSELYGLTSLDEWNSMGFQSAAWRQLDIQENTRTFIGFSRYAFHNLMLNIKSIWGDAVHERIARDILDADFRAAKMARAEMMRKLKLGKFAPKLLAEDRAIFGDWDKRAAKDLADNQQRMFRDFDAAMNARTSGEVTAEYRPYRQMNRLDTSLDVRGFPKGQVPRTPPKVVTLFQSAKTDFSPEQLEWAKESKIRTQDGSSPMVVYHASNAEAPIRVFDRAKQGLGQFGKGFYFTGNETRVKDYGRNVGAYILDMRKPFDVADDNNLRLMYDFERSLDLEKFGARAANKDTDKNWKQYLAETKKLQEKRSSNEYYDSSFLVDVRMSMWESAELSRVNEWLESKGYDGVIGYHEGRRQSPEYIVFRENQIKALENKAPTRGPDTMYQSAFPGGPTQPLGGQPPQRPFNIENMSTAEDVRAFHDIRLQELEADGRVTYNSMSRAEQVAAAEQELGRVADFTGYRTVPELTAALRDDEDALQGFMARHLATRMMLSEAGTQLIQARDAALATGSREDMARFVAMQQRVDVLLEHTRRNQAAIARGLGSQNIVPGPGLGVVRLIDDTMLQDQQMVDDIISASGGQDAIRAAMERSRAAEARGGQAGAVRATQAGHHGILPILTEYWMNSILSGPITFAVNATSNTAAMLYAPLEQALGASITRNFPLVRESLMRYGAFLTEIRESLAYAGVALRTGDNILDAAAPNALGGTGSRRQRAISAGAMGFEDNSRLGAFVNLVGTVVNAPGSALGATDEFFKQMNYRSTVRAGLLADAMQEVAAGRLARDQMGNFVETRFQRMVDQGQFYSERKIRADANNAAAAEIAAGNFTQNSAEHLRFVQQYIRNNWNEADGELARRARATAREATFTNELRRDTPGLEGISAGIQQLVNEHPSLRILIPFIRTPTNLALYFGQRTPITGVMYATPGLNQISTRFSRDIASGDPVRRAQAVGRIAGGTTITVAAIAAAATGVITGSGPKDPEERAYLMKSGWQPYSFKVGNTYISYRKMDPFATFFGMAADLHEAYANADDQNKSAIEVTLKGLVAAVANNIANKTYLTGIVSISNAISDAERHGANWLEQFVGSFVPSLLAQSKDIIGEDPVMRDVQTLGDAIRNRIPGLADGVAPRRDILGEPLRRGRILGAVPLAWPFSYNTATSDPIAKELAQLGAGFTPPRAMRNDVDLRSFTNRRGQSAYDRWQELTGTVTLGGRTLRDAMEKMIQSPEYQRMDPTAAEGYESPRVGMLRKLISRFRDASFRETMREFPDLMDAERSRRATVAGAASGKPFAELLQYSRGR